MIKRHVAAVIALALPHLGHAETPIAAPVQLEDAVVALVLNHCIPEVLGGTQSPPVDGVSDRQTRSDAALFKLSPTALMVPTVRGKVYYDHDSSYCRVLALPADGEAVRDRLIQRFVVMPDQITQDRWRYPDGERTPIEQTTLSLNRSRRGNCIPTVIIYSATRGSRWLDVEIGWSAATKIDPDMTPEMCKTPRTQP